MCKLDTLKVLNHSQAKAVILFIFQEQYMFCYQTILAYLDLLNTYANFADC